MADISVMNVGGSDYNIKDKTSRTNSTKAMSLSAYYETGNTASQAYSIVGTPINWKGTLYYTKTTVAKGATWAVGTNLTPATNLGKLVRNIKTYVGRDSKLHFVDLTGADTALNFSSGTIIADGTISSTATIESAGPYSDQVYTWSYNISDYPNATTDNFIVEISRYFLKAHGIATETEVKLQKRISDKKLIVGMTAGSTQLLFSIGSTCKVTYIP